MPTPIFVLGKHRSGTTWLANQLCQHPRVAGVRHARHYGIHESAYFSVIDGRYGDLSVRSNFTELVAALSASDYFRLAGADREYLHSLWPASYASVFRSVMDRFAERSGASHWVEKSPSHSLCAEGLARLYPDARFIAVSRPLAEVAASSLAMACQRRPDLCDDGLARWSHVLQVAIGWAHYNRALAAFADRSGRILCVQYGELRADLEGSMRQICAFLELPFAPEMCRSPYAPNTSFPRNERAYALSRAEQGAAALVARGSHAVPRSWIRLARATRHRFRPRPALPSWFFSLLDEELEPAVPGPAGAAERAVPTARP